MCLFLLLRAGLGALFCESSRLKPLTQSAKDSRAQAGQAQGCYIHLRWSCYTVFNFRVGTGLVFGNEFRTGEIPGSPQGLLGTLDPKCTILGPSKYLFVVLFVTLILHVQNSGSLFYGAQTLKGTGRFSCRKEAIQKRETDQMEKAYIGYRRFWCFLFFGCFTNTCFFRKRDKL